MFELGVWSGWSWHVRTERGGTKRSHLVTAEDTVTVNQVRKHLLQNGLTQNPYDANTILARKVGQGIVARVSKGVYRVDPRHREIARRWKEMRRADG